VLKPSIFALVPDFDSKTQGALKSFVMADKNKPRPAVPQTQDWAGASDRRKGFSLAGAATFTLLRLADIPLQYYLVSGAGTSLIRYLGGTAVTQPLLTPSNTSPLGLSPYNTLIVALATASAAKHIFWVLCTCDYVFPAPIAVVVATYNCVLNSANTLLALWALTSNSPTNTLSLTALLSQSWSTLLNPTKSTLPYGVALFTVGLATEWIAEIQRKAFKDRPENKDKPFSEGLFGLATNINYGGYTLWRTGYAIVCAGLPWAVAVATWVGGDFVFRAVPGMEAYCEQRYGEQWKQVRAKVPYRLLPWIY